MNKDIAIIQAHLFLATLHIRYKSHCIYLSKATENSLERSQVMKLTSFCHERYASDTIYQRVFEVFKNRNIILSLNDFFPHKDQHDYCSVFG